MSDRSDNLISLGDRPEDERREIAIKGAAASNAVQKQNKQLRTILAEMLSMPIINDENAANALEKLGLEPTQANTMILRLLGIVNGGKDVSDSDRLKACRLVLEALGELCSTPRLTNVSLAVGGAIVEEHQPLSKIEQFRELGDEIKRQMMQE